MRTRRRRNRNKTLKGGSDARALGFKKGTNYRDSLARRKNEVPVHRKNAKTKALYKRRGIDDSFSITFEEVDESIIEIDSTVDDRIVEASKKGPVFELIVPPLTTDPSQSAEKPPEPSGPPLPLYAILSHGIELREKEAQGTTSCRHFVILIISTVVADEYYVIIYGSGSVNLGRKRILLSRIWRQTIEQSGVLYPELKDFFANNQTRMVDRVEIYSIEGISATGKYIVGTTGEERDDRFMFNPEIQIYPMAITNPDGTHVLHYFTIILTEGRIFIYTAYGSDYLRAHPYRVEITFEELNEFIQAGQNPAAHGAIDSLNRLFKKFFTKNADATVRYLDESTSPTRCVTINKETGIQLEIQFYVRGYLVMYFPTVTEELRHAARAELLKIRGKGSEEEQKENLLTWLSVIRGGNKKRSNHRITRHKIRKRYTHYKN